MSTQPRWLGREGGARFELAAGRGGAALTALTGLVVVTVWIASRWVSEGVRLHVADLSYVTLDVIVGLLSWSAARRSGVRGARLGFALFAAAMGCRVFADGAWWWIEAVRHAEPFPSVADVGYVGFYGLTVAALWFLGSRPWGRDRLAQALDLGIVALGTMLAVWFTLLAELASGSAPIEQQVLIIGYPVADAVLITAACALWLRRPSYLPVPSLVLLIVGAVGWALADILWTRLSLGGDYTGGDWLDLLWMSALVAWAGAVLLSCRPVTDREQPHAGATRGDEMPPIAGVVLGIAVTLATASRLPLMPYAPILIGGVGITILVALRQSLVNAEHTELIDKYHGLATTDALTGVYSRSTVIELSERLLERAAVVGTPVAVLMIDIDHFKRINDSVGHAGGDAVLTAVAEQLRSGLRMTDLVGRLGGDEFLVVLPSTETDAAVTVATKLGKAVEARFAGAEGPGRVTLSVGVAGFHGDESLATLLARADAALYRVKTTQRGRALASSDRRPTGAVPGEQRRRTG